MDKAAEIKNNLISRIKDSNDLEFLKAIQTIFDASGKDLYQLSPEQEEAIAIGTEQIENGHYSNNEAVISEMEKWLAKK
ncbi:hypothetical protein LB467_06860 [Salegentibacter sp. JZCK2]|uniref:hypothetical protein n=1 Tax=Salegentibacter tibetensis TaxID=2873600 RepID=UPI001CCE228D|nr:hypothetical protein [Salegentibacter tibetensis]MBZ9729404.1 hypothetical protein [Salegentibacter tibetensis]